MPLFGGRGMDGTRVLRTWSFCYTAISSLLSSLTSSLSSSAPPYQSRSRQGVKGTRALRTFSFVTRRYLLYRHLYHHQHQHIRQKKSWPGMDGTRTLTLFAPAYLSQRLTFRFWYFSISRLLPILGFWFHRVWSFIPKPHYISSLIGLMYFLKFLGPSEKNYTLQSLMITLWK